VALLLQGAPQGHDASLPLFAGLVIFTPKPPSPHGITLTKWLLQLYHYVIECSGH